MPCLTPDASGIIDAASYADLIPGRDTLFVASTAPKPKFLFETRAVFIDKGLYLGSEYFLSQFGDYDPEALPTRLGDAYFENQLVRQAILRETGQRWLNVQVKDDQAQMKALLDGGLQASRDMNLAFGITLTKEHIAALTQDIIWYEETIYQGRTVLVPKLYLASATRANIRAKFDNKGAVLSGTNVTIAADSIDNDKGIITASNDITLTAANDITSTSAEIAAGNDIALTSTDGSVDITMQVNQYTRNLGGGAYVGFAINNERSKVDAGGKLTITAKDNITVKGSDIAAGGDANLTAGGDVDIGVKALRTASVFPGDTIAHQVKNIGSTATMGGDLQINAGGDVRIKGSQIESNGDVGIAAVGALTIESSTDTNDGVGQQGGKGFRDEVHTATQNASSISADGNIDITSGGDARVTSSTLEADGNLSLQATGNVTIESAADGYHVQSRKYKLKTITQKSSTLEADGDVTVGSLAGDMSIISSEIDAGGDITLTTPGGILYLGARKDYFEEHISETKNGTFISTYINRGQIDETVVPTLLTANGNLAIVTGDGVIVDYKDTGNLNDSIDQLSQASGLAWMTDLRARNDVTWNAVTEAHESWNYRSQGISPTGAAIISIAVGWATAGMGSAYLASAQGVEVAALNGTMAAMADAGFTALINQASQALVGNGGDIGAALQQLGSSNTLKSLATSMVTAGLLESLPLDGLTTSTDALSGSTLKMTNFTNNLKIAMAQGTISATVDSVINGAPLGDNLKGAMLNAVVTVAGAEVANVIGQQAANNATDPTNNASAVKIAQLASHAVLGCSMGAANGGDCQSGAMGAVLGELIGEAIDQAAFEGTAVSSGNSFARNTVLSGGKLGALLITELAGGDGTVAVDTAANAILNNYLYPKEKKALIDELVSCGSDQNCRETVQSGYETISDKRDSELTIAMLDCKFTRCDAFNKVHWDLRMNLTKEGNEYYKMHSRDFIELPPSKSVWHSMKIDTKTGKPTDLILGSNGNRKFYHPDYGYEVVLDTANNIVVDRINLGTYNLYNPTSKNGGENPLIANDKLHGYYDVVPYLLAGNAPDDLSTMFDRALRGLNRFTQ